MKQKRDSQEKPKYPLETALDFERQDPEANEISHLSDDQHHILRRVAVKWFLAVCFLFAFGGLTFPYNLKPGGPAGQVGEFVLISVVVVPMLYYTIPRWLLLTIDLIIGKANRVEGYVALDVRAKRRGEPNYTLDCEGVTFKLTKPVFLAFKNGDPYTIYYLPLSKRVISAAWLR